MAPSKDPILAGVACDVCTAGVWPSYNGASGCRYSLYS